MWKLKKLGGLYSRKLTSNVTSVDALTQLPRGGISAAPGFSLGHGFPLIPEKLVAKIQRWEYVNLLELLPDNLELARGSLCEHRGSSSCATTKAPKKRELVDDWKGFTAWSVCFNTLAAIVEKKHSAKSQELLAYHSTLLVEALRFGCRGWMSYDRMFLRRNQARTGRSCTLCSILSPFLASVWMHLRAQSAWAPITAAAGLGL